MKNPSKIIFLLLIVVNSSLRLNAQDFWQYIDFPDTVSIHRLTINSSGHIFAGTLTEGDGLEGVYRSTDSGLTWQFVLSSNNFQVNEIAINSMDHIYVNTNGLYTFWKSTDNGDTWSLLNYSSQLPITKIYCLGQDSLLIGCTDGGAMMLLSPDGGITYDTLFRTYNPGERITDIDVAPNGDIYCSLMCFFPDMGGVYKSTDHGITWNEIGMINHQVQAVKVNSLGDVFIGVYFDFLGGGGGLYALYHDSFSIDSCLLGPMVNGLGINVNGDIYAGTGGIDGVFISKDNGHTFEMQNSGMTSSPKSKIIFDSQNYAYVIDEYPAPYLYKSTEPTFVDIQEFRNVNPLISIFPNPVSDFLTIKLTNELINTNNLVEIYDINGNKVFNDKISFKQNIFELDVSSLLAGIYLIRIQNFRILASARFIKS